MEYSGEMAKTETYWRTVLGYRVRIWIDELDGGYVAECVDLPGCFSQGDSLVSTIANVANAISGCLQAAENAAVVDEDET